MGDTHSGAGDRLKTSSPTKTMILNERKPNKDVVNALTNFKIMAIQNFPELEGTIYNELNKLVQADFSERSTMGVYSNELKKIAIANRISKDNEAIRDTVAHELAHALTASTRRGFRSIDDTFDRAFRQYRRTHRTASEQSFARSISSYADRSREEAFSEAFSDYLRNGKNATEASRLLMQNWRTGRRR